MTKKRKKNLIVKIIARVLGSLAIAVAIIAMFAGAYLQESYRLNPPSEAERAEHPFIVGFLSGSNSEADESALSKSLPHSPLFGISECRKPNELCRVGTLAFAKTRRGNRREK